MNYKQPLLHTALFDSWFKLQSSIFAMFLIAHFILFKNQIKNVSLCLSQNITAEITLQKNVCMWFSVIWRISWVGLSEVRCGRGHHDSWEAAVLVERVHGQCGDAGQRGTELHMTAWIDVGGGSRALRCYCCCWVVSWVWPWPVCL